MSEPSKGITERVRLSDVSFPIQYPISQLNHPRYELLQPITVTVELDRDTHEYIISDDQIDMYGIGESLTDALYDYQISIVEYFELLMRDEEKLEGRLKRHFDYLKRIIRE